jgi:hypothetical protein
LTKKTLKNILNKEQKPSHRREAVVRYASKALRPPEAGRTGGVTGEENETLVLIPTNLFPIFSCAGYA